MKKNVMPNKAMDVAIDAEDKRHDLPIVIHDLFSRPIRPISSWKKWLDRWQLAESIEEMLGLLHVGFNVPLAPRVDPMFPGDSWGYSERQNPNDRILFYLRIADGWTNSYNLEREEDGRVEYYFSTGKPDDREKKSLRDLRQIVAQKAFDMLCIHFFKVSPYDPVREEQREWIYGWISKMPSEIFTAIMHFYRAEVGRYGNRIEIRNLDSPKHQSHNEKSAINFLLELSKFIWAWGEEKIQSYDKPEEQTATKKRNEMMRALLDSAKPWMIEILAKLGEIDSLENRMLVLDEACLAKIEEIALGNKFESSYDGPVKVARPVATLDEARYLGSNCAWFLKRRELIMSEGARLKAIRKAEETLEKAQREVEKLQTTSK